MTTIRTLNDLTVDELKGMISDLQNGVRYNDIKVKYQIPNFIFTRDTMIQCRDLITERDRQSQPIVQIRVEGIVNHPNMIWTWTADYHKKTNPASYNKFMTSMNKCIERGYF